MTAKRLAKHSENASWQSWLQIQIG